MGSWGMWIIALQEPRGLAPPLGPIFLVTGERVGEPCSLRADFAGHPASRVGNRYPDSQAHPWVMDIKG